MLSHLLHRDRFCAGSGGASEHLTPPDSGLMGAESCTCMGELCSLILEGRAGKHAGWQKNTPVSDFQLFIADHRWLHCLVYLHGLSGLL